MVVAKNDQIIGLMDVGVEGAEWVREGSPKLFEVDDWMWVKGLETENEMKEWGLVLGKGKGREVRVVEEMDEVVGP